MAFERRAQVAVLALALLVMVGASVLAWDNARTDLAPRFQWPDETSNAYFAERIARGEPLAVAEPRNVVAGNLIHPRTVNVRSDGALVPGGYLGLPLVFGFVGRIAGERAMLFLTPLFAGLALLAFARIVAALWDLRVALIATALLAFHATLWMFAATSFLPNVPFVALLLMGFAVLVDTHPLPLPLKMRGRVGESICCVQGGRGQESPPPLLEGGVGGVGRWLLGSILIGAALAIRTHEVLWVAALGIAFAWWQRASWAQVGAGIVGVVLPFIPVLALNAELYGSPFVTGYALLQDGGALPTEFAASGGIARALVAPFGWHAMAALERFWMYMIAPFPWFFVLAFLGIVSGAAHAHERRRIIAPALLAAWLVLFYGSWTIADPLVRTTNVLTISYARYWLPVVFLLAPLAAVGALAFLSRIPSRAYRAVIAALVIVGIAFSSGQRIVRDPLEGLAQQRAALTEHRARARAVITATPDDAVIVSHRMDKVFFPERAVVAAPEEPDADFTEHLRALVDVAPVYWYAPSKPPAPGVVLTPVGAMPFNEQLYRVEKL